MGRDLAESGMSALGGVHSKAAARFRGCGYRRDGCALSYWGDSVSVPIRRSNSRCSGPCVSWTRNRPRSRSVGWPPEDAFGSCLTNTRPASGSRTRYQRSPLELLYSSRLDISTPLLSMAPKVGQCSDPFRNAPPARAGPKGVGFAGLERV